MADRYENTSQIDTGNVVKTRMSASDAAASGGSALNAMIHTLGGFVDQMSDVLDKETVARAKKAGALAGLSDELHLASGGTLAGDTFNKAATEIYLNKTTVDVSTRVQALLLDPSLKSNPEAMGKALEQLRGSYVSHMPLEVIPEFMVQYNNQAQRATQNTMVSQYNDTMAEGRASFQEAQRDYQVKILNAAREGNMPYVENEINNYHRFLDRNGTEKSGGTGYSTPEQIVGAKIDIEKGVQTQVIIGQLMRAPDSAKPALLNKLLTDPKFTGDTTPKEREEAVGDVISAFNSQTAVQKAMIKESGESEKAQAYAMEKVFVMDPSPDNFMKLMAMPGFHEPMAAYSHLVSRTTQDDPFVVKQLDTMLMEGKQTELRQALSLENDTSQRITAKTRQEYYEKLGEQEQGQGFEKTPQWQEVNRRLQADFPKDLFGLTPVNPQEESLRRQLYDFMRTQWPQYKDGKVKEFPDVLREYDLKHSMMKKTSDQNVNQVTLSDGTAAVIPQKYIANPDQLASDLDAGLADKRLNDPSVFSYLAKMKIQQSVKGNKP